MQQAGSILSLFAAEEIPAAMITFVSLLLFLQTGTSPGLSVCYSALLSLPWVLKSFLREKVRRTGRFRRALQWSELLLVICLVLLGLALNPSARMFRVTGMVSGNGGGIFVILFFVSLLTAWHELASRMYYERMLRPKLQRMYNGPKMFVSQMMAVFTYGLLIIVVGTLQVLCRSIFVAWSVGMLSTAFVLSLFFMFHLYSLQVCPVGDQGRSGSVIRAVRAELHIVDRIHKRHGWHRPVWMLFVLLLPQSLMFYSRVLYFLFSEADGGLGRSLQDVGFAQGVVGVIAFCLGLYLGRRWMWGDRQMADGRTGHDMIAGDRDRYKLLILLAVLTLSPLVYLALTCLQNPTLWQLAMAAFLAQLCFGIGLNGCQPFVHEISGGRYRNSVNYLNVPLVAAVMLIPVLVSGWLVTWLGFRYFFLFDVLTAPLAWICLVGFSRQLPRQLTEE